MSLGSVLPVLLFTSLYLAAAAVAAIGGGNIEFVLYIGVVVLFAGLVGVVHHRVHLATATLWALSLWGLAHMLGGLLPVPSGWPIGGEQGVLYSLWLIPGRLKYDHVVHAYGFGVTTWVCWQGFRAALAGAAQVGVAAVRPTFGLLVLAAAAGLGFGALNEVVEFAATLLVPETNVGGYANTGWDLVANLVGASVAAGVIALSPGSSAARVTPSTRR